MAKEQTDDGWFCCRNVSTLAADVGCNRHSIVSWIGRETSAGRLSSVQNERFQLRFTITNYNDSQRLRRYKPTPKAEPKAERKHISRAEHIDGLKVLKIDKSIFEEFKKEIPGVNHDDELKNADLWRLDNPSKSQNPNDHLFLKNWFKRAKKGKDEKGESDLSKYDGL